MNTVSNYIGYLDKIAISASMICAIHCLSLPLLIILFPALGATTFGQEVFHVWLLWLVIPMSVVALTLGCRSHKDFFVAVLGATGLTILVLAAILGHDLLGEIGERIAMLLGAFAIAASHVRNYTLCRYARCAGV